MDKRDFEILRGLYRAELTYLDDRISELLVQFEEAGVREDTVFIITGDHGENIGDHGLMDHQYSLHETLLHVPLVIEGPGFDSEENVERPTQLLDIFPTVLDLADADFDREEYVGRSLCDIESLSENRPRLTEYVAPQPAIRTLAERYDCSRSVERYDRRLWALKHGDEKYVRGSDGTEWLYDLGEDPNEQTELSDQRPERCQTLSDDLDAYLEELPDATEYTSDVSMDAATEQRLEDLGYLQ